MLVNGVCLTAVEPRRGRASRADLSPETLARSSLGALGRATASTSSCRCGRRTGSAATSCRATSTASATVAAVERRTAARATCASRLPPELLRYVVEKGSIAVDGVSLTVTDGGRRGLRGLADPGDARADQPRHRPPGPPG